MNTNHTLPCDVQLNHRVMITRTYTYGLNGVKELLADNLAVNHVENTYFVHIHAWHAFKGYVHAHSAREVFVSNNRLTAPARVHFFHLLLKLYCFFANGSKALCVLKNTAFRLNADGVLAVQLIYNLVVTACLSQLVVAVGNFFRCHCCGF